MKKCTAILSVLLILALCLSFAACGEKSTDTKSKEEAATEAPKGYEIGKSYHWSEIDFELADLTDDLSNLDNSHLSEAEGKYIAAKFDITKGELSSTLLSKKSEEEAITLSGGKFATYIAQGMKGGQEITDDAVFLFEGPFYFIFDVPKDYSLDDAILTVKED